MVIYDSLTQTKKELKDKKINIYNCGPTVYNEVHIGNIRPLITFDILHRFLLALKNNVKYVHNITDVDDKIINKAKEENVSESAISEKYTKDYFELMKRLNVLKMNKNPLVTKNIKGIIDYVNRLVKLKKAYVTKQGDVYFSIDSVKDTYGELSKQKIDDLLNGVRKENHSDKKNPLDFVLWKATKEGVNWESPWNEHGRPGWHTECAYFINKFFGDQVTIHGGGIDLKFPHHENENAQNIALTGKEMAQIWMHVGHINMNNVKMSKSLGNFVYANELLNIYGPNAIRWFFLQTQYENPIEFSKEILEQAKAEIVKVFRSINVAIIQLYMDKVDYKYKQTALNDEFIKALEDDLNFPNAVAVVYKQVKGLSLIIKNKNYNDAVKVLNAIINEFSIFGIEYISPLNKEIKKIADEWKQELDAKNYSAADINRNKLIEKGIV